MNRFQFNSFFNKLIEWKSEEYIDTHTEIIELDALGKKKKKKVILLEADFKNLRDLLLDNLSNKQVAGGY